MKKNTKPLVTVIMPVYNPGEFLADAVESILSQSFADFEFIIVDDASTDHSWKIIQKYARQDKRIIPLRNYINLGVSLTANIAISRARGRYLARMDADDVSSPERLEKQLKFFTENPQAILVGGQCTIIDRDGYAVGFKRFPLSPHQALLDMLFWAVPVQQGYMMVDTKKLPKDFVWYSASKSSAEEIDLFFRLADYGDFANLPENLYFYRHLPGSLSRLNPKKTFYLTLQSRLKAVQRGYRPSAKAWILTMAQILTVAVVPASLIYDLWYLFRGVSQIKAGFNTTLARIGVKS